jgi:spore maturation protein CgeB
VHASTDSLPAIRAKRMRALWHVAESGPLDVVIVCHDFLWPEEVAELKRRTGAAVAMWFPDAMVNFGRAFFMNAEYDGLFFKDPFIVKTLSGVLTSPVYYLPECFNPNKHFLPNGELPNSKYQCDITTAGNQHSWRVAFYKHLSSYNVKIWGQPAPLWMPTGPVAKMYQKQLVLNQDKARAFLGAKIVLNNLHFGEIDGLNVRAFEAAGIGAFQIVDFRPGLSQLFVDGKELISFSGIDDLKQKLDYWLPRLDERLEIAKQGKIRAYKDHTYQLRLSLLIETLYGKSKGFSMPKNIN